MARVPKGSLPLRVLAIGFLVFAVPLMVYFALLYRADYERDRERVLLGLQELGRGRADLFAAANLGCVRATRVIQDLAEQDWDNLSNILNGVVKGSDLTFAFYVSIEEKGYIQTAPDDPETLGEDYSGYRSLQIALEQGQVSVLALSGVRLEKLLYVVKLVSGSEGPKGFIVVARDISALLETLLSSPDLGFTVHSSILTPGSAVFASGDPDLNLQVIAADEPGLDLQVEPLAGVEGAYTLEWEGEDQIAIETPIEGTDFSFLVTATEADVFAYQTKRLLHAIVIFFALIAIGGGIALYLTQKMAVPLRNLTGVMHAVSQGDLSARFEKKPMGFEINRLGVILNETLESLSRHMASANAERVKRETLQKELDIGQEIQRSILPHTKPTFPGLDIGARYLPSKQVGGDFYDVFVKPSNGQDVVLTIADASGKGISACLYALCIRSMLRSFTTKRAELSQIIREANNVFCEDTADTGMFVTVFSALYRASDKRLIYSSNGHNPAYLRRKGGEIIELQGRGIALGIQRLDEVETDEIQTESGDLILMYTDGVTEAHNAKMELFGEERLLSFLKQDLPEDAEEVADHLVEEVERFCAGHPQHDDITIMAVRVL